MSTRFFVQGRSAAAGMLLGGILCALAGAGEVALRIVPDASMLPQENLLTNSSFEELNDQVPAGWSWSQRNTDATCSPVAEAHGGKTALCITNGTPFGAHVYAQLRQQENLKLEPGKQYTLSAYVKGTEIGPAWIGGGDGWWLRQSLADRHGGDGWRRVVKSFTARDADGACPIMVNTDGPTKGFLIDDLKLEAGARATFYFDPSTVAETAAIVWDPPAMVSCKEAEVAFPAAVWVAEGAEPTPLVVQLQDEAGQILAQAQSEPCRPGLNGFMIHWPAEVPVSGQAKLCLSAGPARAEAAFRQVTAAHYAAERQLAQESADRLAAAVAEARAQGRAIPEARAALAIAGRFLKIADQKRDVNLLPEALADAEYLIDLCGQNERVVREILAGTRASHEIPDPDLSKTEIRAGNFWAEGQPVMLVGGMGFGELKDEIDVYKEYGFNSIDGDFYSKAAFRMQTSDNQFDETAIPGLLEWRQRFAQMNLANSFNPTLHYFPFWAMQQFADITGGDPVDCLPDWSGRNRHAGKRTKVYGGFFPFAIDSPNLRRLVSQYYAKLMPELAKAPDFCVTWLMNEPTYKSKDPHYVELFREYLQRKYPDVAALNVAWGTQFKAFGEIGYPDQNGAPAKFDWLTFHQDQVAGWFEWLAAEVKKNYPQAILSNKPMAWTLLHPELGIDFEREAELWEVPGCDAGRMPESRDYSFAWEEAARLFDFQRSVAPDKPLADLEYHYVHWPDLSAEYARATYFHSYLHGLRKSEFWYWSKGELDRTKNGGAGSENTAWSQPKIAWGTAMAALDLRRLAKYVAAFPGRPEALIYFSKPSLYLDNAAASTALSLAHQAATGLDAPIGFATDKMIRAGRLAGVKLLIVPGAKQVQNDVLQKIEEFAAAGGKVLLQGECLTQDEYGRPRAAEFAGAAAALRAESAKADELVAAFDAAFAAAKVSRPVRTLLVEGGPAWPLECRYAEVDGERVVYLVGLNKAEISVKLQAEAPFAGWEDLISGETGADGQLTVKPLDVKLLRLK